MELAKAVLESSFPTGPGRVCAMISFDGTVYTGALDPGPPPVEPEVGPMEQARVAKDVIAASVTVSWEGPGSSLRFRTPSETVLRSLHFTARREALIAVDGPFDPKLIPSQPLRELINVAPNAALLGGNFGAGMKAIKSELNQLARDPGMPTARAEFARYVNECLNESSVLSGAEVRIAHVDGSFFMPTSLASIALRHAWLAIDLAAVRFTHDLVQTMRPRLIEIGCNEADLVHIKQAIHAFRYSVANALVYVELRGPVEHEIPFYPSGNLVLAEGVAMHEYVALPPLDLALEGRARERKLITDLAELMGSPSKGGLFEYARQRGIYTLDVFSGGGPGRCPFWRVSGEMFQQAAKALEIALHLGTIRLAPEE